MKLWMTLQSIIMIFAALPFRIPSKNISPFSMTFFGVSIWFFKAPRKYSIPMCPISCSSFISSSSLYSFKASCNAYNWLWFGQSATRWGSLHKKQTDKGLGFQHWGLSLSIWGLLEHYSPTFSIVWIWELIVVSTRTWWSIFVLTRLSSIIYQALCNILCLCKVLFCNPFASTTRSLPTALTLPKRKKNILFISDMSNINTENCFKPYIQHFHERIEFPTFFSNLPKS